MPARGFGTVLLLACAAAAQAQPTTARATDAAALFGGRETVEHIDLSPDGTRIVYVGPGDGRASIAFVADLATSIQREVLRVDGDPERLESCDFGSDTRLVCRIAGVEELGGIRVPFSRLFVMDANGGPATMLGQEGSWYDARVRQFDGFVVDWLRGDEGQILLAREYVPEQGKIGTRMVRDADGLGIDRVDLATLGVEKVEPATRSADLFISDGSGNIRIKGFQPDRGGTGYLDARVEYSYRLQGDRQWMPFSTWDENGGMQPIAVDAQCDCAYALKKLDGRLALYRVKLDGTKATELVYANPRVDVDDVVRLGRRGRVVGVTYAEEKRKVIYFDKATSDLADSLGKALPGLPMIGFLAVSADGSRLVVRAGSDADPGRYYLYDQRRNALNELLLARPALEHVQLANVSPVTYPAADGTLVPAYLTLPPGRAQAQGLPAVVLPHGGPAARDEWGFDWLAQYLAHLGFAVLQPNFRGSAGFGDNWLQKNGFRSWKTSIGDVTSAGRWLVGQGIADPDRLAIVGWSYGGYAALQSGVLEPALFKAIVAIAPVADLDLLKRDAHDYTNWRNVVEEIGDGPHIVEGSPRRNAGKILAPVLMFHGTMDVNVEVGQAREMDAALHAAGKDSTLVIFDGLDHGLRDSGARTRMLGQIGAFLQSRLAPQATPPAQ